jgi:DNA topoisomerase-3
VTQSLRDNFKAITYNRSDCRYLNNEQFNDAPQTIAAVSAALSGTFPRKFWPTSTATEKPCL